MTSKDTWIENLTAERDTYRHGFETSQAQVTTLLDSIASLRTALEQKFNEEQVGQWLSALETGATATQRRDAYYSLRAYFEPMRDALAALTNTPTQAGTQTDDQARAHFAAGYTTALDDSLGNKA